MCLVDKKQFRYAEKDIPIFKVAVKCPHGKIVSPFRRTRLWRVNNITENYTNKCNINNITMDLYDYYQFDEGFFHAFVNEYTANRCVVYFEEDKFYEENPDYKIIVVTGYIPEGTRYAVDILGAGEICARRMVLNI